MLHLSPISCSVDLAALGKRIGRLHVSWLDGTLAYGVIPCPTAVIAGGAGAIQLTAECMATRVRAP
jgi:hypothetical protein